MTKVIYPGSFDPFTNGHKDILDKARSIFDEVVVAIGKDPNKNYMFSVPERVRMIQDVTQKWLDKVLNVEVLPYAWLLVDFVYEQGVKSTVRWIRWFADLEQEALIHYVGESQKMWIQSLFMLATQDQTHVASSVTKAVLKEQGQIDQYVKLNVKHFMEARMLGQYIVGITWTIGAGKSYFSDKFVELGQQHNIAVHNIDLDKIGHRILGEAPEIGYQKVREELFTYFGEGIKTPEWFVDRKELGKLVFWNSEKMNKLDEIMTTPMLLGIRREMMGKKWIILLNGALLAETGLSRLANNNIVLIDTDRATQEQRLAARWHTPEQIETRVNSQFSGLEKKAVISKEIEDAGHGAIIEVQNKQDSNDKTVEEAFNKMLETVDVFGELRVKSILAKLWLADKYPEIMSKVKTLYDAPERIYHNWFHIVACLDHLYEIHEMITPQEFEQLFFAILFHDTIYSPTAPKGENESNSAMLCAEYLQRRGVSTETIMDTTKLILLTANHTVESGNLIEKYMIDIDLSILWQDRFTYERYAYALRHDEYKIYPDPMYVAGRMNFIEGFVKRQIFQSTYFYYKYEDKAQKNMKKELAILKAGGKFFTK